MNDCEKYLNLIMEARINQQKQQNFRNKARLKR